MTTATANAEMTAESYRTLAEAASAARTEGRIADAVGWFAQLRQRFPDRPEPFAGAAALLAEIGCTAEAEIVLAAARACFPNDPAMIAAQAELAGSQGHLCSALDHWAALQATHPATVAALLGEAATRADHGAFATADTVIDTACARFPDDPSPWIASIRLAAARPDPAEAARRLATARDRFGDDPRFEAPETLAPALLDADMLREAAADAAAGERWALAADICTTLRERYPGQLVGYVEGAAAAAALGDGAAANTLLDVAERRHGTSPELTLARARLAAARQAWSAAIAGFEAARAALPDDPAPVVGLVRSLRAAGHADAAAKALAFGLRQLPDSVELRLERVRTAEAHSTEAPAASTPADPATTRRLLAGFVSLGAAQGSGELARLRRAHGVGGRGLLDEAELGPESLAAMLEAGFDGVGAPENTELRTLPPIAEDEAPSWALADRRGWFVVRSALSPTTLPAPLALTTGSAWLRAGAASLAMELRSGRCCFVYRMPAPAPSLVLDRLRRALRGRRLVLLCAPDAAHPAGSVVREPNGLLVGRVPTLHFQDEAAEAEAIACWLDVLAALARDEVRTPVGVEERADQLLETA